MLPWLLAVWMAGPTPPPDASVIPFRTESVPRVDPVFGDTPVYRERVDRFLALHAEMERVRDEFSSAVHSTLGELGWSDPRRKSPRGCPESTARHYARAAAAGGRYLLLGRQLEARFREVRRHDDLGDTLALTPDYRWKVKKARELYLQVLRDLREMRIAFYDQLSAEMRHAGCPMSAPDAGTPGAATAAAQGPDPADPAAWNLDAGPADESAGAPAVPPDRPAKAGAPAPAAGGPTVWIEIDNSRCAEPSRLAIDGSPLGEIGSRKRTSVRARSGPHEICILPASDTRPCGAPGTLRKAYLHEGWSLTVRCGR